jgi:hypothetical protein
MQMSRFRQSCLASLPSCSASIFRYERTLGFAGKSSRIIERVSLYRLYRDTMLLGCGLLRPQRPMRPATGLLHRRE